MEADVVRPNVNLLYRIPVSISMFTWTDWLDMTVNGIGLARTCLRTRFSTSRTYVPEEAPRGNSRSRQR